MSAQEQMRQMLDQLMGTGRDGENNRFKVHFTDPRVCKSFLLGCCPHDILAATRMDLGECPRIHDLALRADYESASKKKDYYYDVDAMEHLQNFINECDRRTEQAKRRLAETQEELSSEVTLKLNRVHELAEQIGKKLAEAEKQGAEGNVEESLKLMEEVEEFRKQKATAEQDYRNSMPASSYQQQKLRVCEVCSAYLGIHDNDRRLADHFGGKLHLGFITIRERLDDLKKSVNERRQKARTERDREFDKDERDWRNKWPPVSRSRSRSRSQSRRHRKFTNQCQSSEVAMKVHALCLSENDGENTHRTTIKSRSRSQERRHYRSRSRSHSPRSRHSSSHRSRSRDRKRRNHSRDRSRERKHHRSSERYKRRHSRDKERSSES